jgi:hypothetical protein
MKTMAPKEGLVRRSVILLPLATPLFAGVQ